jgi:hypothetical protein
VGDTVTGSRSSAVANVSDKVLRTSAQSRASCFWEQRTGQPVGRGSAAIPASAPAWAPVETGTISRKSTQMRKPSGDTRYIWVFGNLRTEPSAPPAIRRALPSSEHRRHKGLNNRAENSHLPTRNRDRILQRFKSAEHAQRLLVPFSAVSNQYGSFDSAPD